MEEKSTNQNGQSNQGNQHNKPALSWTQPASAPAQMQNGAQQPKPGTAPVVTVTAPAQAQSGFKTGSIIVGIFLLCVLAIWGMVALRHKSESVVSITGTSTDEADNTSGAQTPAEESTTTPTSSETTISQTTTPPAGEVSVAGSLPITVASPQPAGMDVRVSGVSVSVPTWFVVYQDNAGVPGNALGAGLFLPGANFDSIPLLRATTPGSSYFVGESVDDGDKVFTLHGDPQVKDAQGNVLLAKFQTN